MAKKKKKSQHNMFERERERESSISNLKPKKMIKFEEFWLKRWNPMKCQQKKKGNTKTKKVKTKP